MSKILRPGGDNPTAREAATPDLAIPGGQSAVVTAGAAAAAHEEAAVGVAPATSTGAAAAAEEEDQGCGWGRLQPACLQPLRTPPCALLALCMASFLQGLAVNGYVNVVLPTVERRFQLRSVQLGTIISAYNVGSLLFSTPVAYLGGTQHKPRIIAVGTLVMATGSLVFALPHFLAESYNSRFDVHDTCPNRHDYDTLCAGGAGSTLAEYRYLFMLGNFLHGCGASPFYTLGVAYLDDNVPTKTSPVYLGVYFAMAILGPGVGFISGGYFLSMYTDITKPASEVKINRFSKVWVGAWWLGFVIASILAYIVAIPIWAFPKHLPGHREIQDAKKLEAKGSHDPKSDEEKPDSFFALVCALLTNRTFVLLTIAGTIETMMASGISAFITKILEAQFGLTSSATATLLGIIAIPSAVGGTLLGGYLIDKFDLACSQIIRMSVFASMFTWLAMGFVLWHCPAAPYAGVSFDKGYHFEPNQTCNAECQCSEILYSPICGMDNTTYYSPCYAGCHEEHVAEGTVLYMNCSCIEHSEKRPGAPGPVNAELTRCQTPCTNLYPFSVGLFCVLFGTFINSAPGLSATIRTVGDTAKPLALGLQWVSVRLFGTILAPIAIGSIIDRSCLTWQTLCGGLPGACLIYENASMSYNLFGLLILLKTLSVFFFFLAWTSYVPPKSGGARVQ
ncbi:solute carrier organic anion transporter family member 4A1-like [Haemaphysalis longicornis]